MPGGKPRIDDEIKKRILRNINQLIRKRRFNYKTLEEALKHENVTVSEHTIRTWERDVNQKSASIPSLHHMIALSKVLRVSLDDLVGVQSRDREALFEVVRRSISEEEEHILECLHRVTSEYPNEPEEIHLDSDLQTIHKHIFSHLLFNNLIYVYPERIQRDHNLEEKLRKEKDLLDTRVLILPGGEKFPEVRNYFFNAAAANYLEEIVNTGCSRIGLAAGRTVASMMHMVKRGSLKNTVLFPILLTGGAFALMTISSTAIVAEAVFRHKDYGVRVPRNIYEDTFFSQYLNTADALFFSLGNNQSSTLVEILQSVGIQKEQISYFAGDLLFNLLTREGQTTDEIDEKPPEIEEICNKLNSNTELARLPLPLNLVSQNVSRGLLTVTLICGLEKAQIAKAVFARSRLDRLKSVSNVLLTDLHLAKALLEN
ncbi:hypothetical protein FJZ31_22100 [Candidatus Poribacteria bacterium]|nr:hypothetical protein [Candidatus Poribacteria bacterium]